MTDNTTLPNTGSNTQQVQQPNADPAATGGNKGKLFTQDEVNRIVSERLNREREKAAQAASPAEPTEADRKLAEITATENRLRCKEFLLDNKQYPTELLELYDTRDFEAFKDNAEKLLKMFPQLSKDSGSAIRIASGAAHNGVDNVSLSDKIASVFKPKI